MAKLYDQVRKANILRAAWRTIFENGVSSASRQTRAEVTEFSSTSETSIQRIATQLREKRFVFEVSHGIAIPKRSNPTKKRPIVTSPIPNRIVQRAILDVLQSVPQIRIIQNSRLNFGGVHQLGVPDAVTEAYKEALKNRYFVRTDIKAFFDNIPRPKAIGLIAQITNESEFNELLTHATNTELDNLSQLGRDKELFPLEEIGVAQGSCLSPLLCNLLLHDFDVRMNQRGISCIRYIDDFILFGPNEKNVFRAFENARNLLSNLGLDIYDPRKNADKAERGVTDNGFDFLGCNIRWDRIRPSQVAQQRIRNRVGEVFRECKQASSNPKRAVQDRLTYADCVKQASNRIRGWGNTYAFCTDDRLMNDLDKTLNEAFRRFNAEFKQLLSRHSPDNQRRLLGLFPLADCNQDPNLRQLVAQEKKRRTSNSKQEKN